MVAGISDLEESVPSQPLTPQDREGKWEKKERAGWKKKIRWKKRGKCWTSRLGRSFKRGEKGRGGFRIFTANIPFSTRHPMEKGNLSLS